MIPVRTDHKRVGRNLFQIFSQVQLFFKLRSRKELLIVKNGRETKLSEEKRFTVVENKQEKNDLVAVAVVVIVVAVVASYLLKLSHGVLVGRFLQQGPANAAGVHR